MRKTRRTYVRPTSEVVELHVTNQLLQASVGATMGTEWSEETAAPPMLDVNSLPFE